MAEQKFPLPPCRVCNAPGTGFHYGVNTCEACKGFFHRSLTYYARYKCDHTETCVILSGKGKMCRKCRYKKCLDLGMSKSAIKTGRYNYRKKTEDILEVKQLEVMGEDDVDSQKYFAQDVGETSTASGYRDKSSHDDLDRSRLTLNSLSMSDFFGNALSEYEIGQEKKVITSFSEQPIISDQSVLLRLSPSTPDSAGVDIRSPCLYPIVLRDDDPSLTLTPSSSSISGSDQSSPSSVVWDLQLQSSPSPNKRSQDDHRLLTTSQQDDSRDNTRLSSNEKAHSSSCHSSSSQTLMSSSFPEPTHHFPDTYRIEAADSHDIEIDNLYEDKETTIKILVNAHEKYVYPHFPDIPKDEIAKQQREHYEACLLHKEMFGGRHRLHDHEYDDIYTKTGIDIDGRQWSMLEYAKSMEKVIQRMVTFAKVIPGFSKLTTVEKTNLIKYSRQEFCFLNLFKYINSELKVYKGVERCWQCSMDLENSTMRQSLDLIFNFLAKFQLMNLTYTEGVILQALGIMAPDRSNPVTTTTIPAIYHKLVDLLVYEFNKRMDRPMLHFAKVMGLITECRTKEEDLTEMFKRENLIRYTPLNDKPFLQEMFAGIYIAGPDENSDNSTN